MARLVAIVLILGMYRPDTLLAGVVFEAGEIDSNAVQPGAFVEVIYGKGERHSDTRAWEKLETGRGYLKAMDEEHITIGGRFWQKEIAAERVQKLTVLDSERPARKFPFEIGANLMSIQVWDAESRWTIINLGGGNGLWSFTYPSFYISSFIFDQMAFDLAMGLTSVSRGNGGSSWTLWTGHSGITYFLQEGNAPYVKSFATILGGSESDSSFGAGVGIGYRHVVQNIMALRFEARYVRWFEARENHINIRMTFGVVLGGK